MSMKNSNDTIGNRTCYLPVCSAVPQTTAPPAAYPQSVPATCTKYSTEFSWNWTQLSVVWSRYRPPTAFSTVSLSDTWLHKLSKRNTEANSQLLAPVNLTCWDTRNHQNSPRQSGTWHLCTPELKSFDIGSHYRRSGFLFWVALCHVLRADWQSFCPVQYLALDWLTDWLKGDVMLWYRATDMRRDRQTDIKHGTDTPVNFNKIWLSVHWAGQYITQRTAIILNDTVNHENFIRSICLSVCKS